MTWEEERDTIVNTKTGEYRKVDPIYFYGIGLDPGWKWMDDLSKEDILLLWKNYRSEEIHIVY